MKNFYGIVLAAGLMLAAGTVVQAQCKAGPIVKGCRKNLSPFKFSGAAETDIVVGNKPKTIEVEFTAYEDEKYRLIFCTAGNFSEPVKVNIYDDKKSNKMRNKVYDSESGIDNLFWVFEPSRTGNYYIEYEVPQSADGTTKTGCVVLIIGYQAVE